MSIAESLLCRVLYVFALWNCILAQLDGHLRLVNGTARNNGRVEVYFDGRWGTICDNRWDSSDSNVVCRQLGFERAQRTYYRAFRYGEGTGPILLEGLNCRGNEQSILECRHNGWGVTDCTHREDAGVECKRKIPVKPREMNIKLACPNNTQDGTCMTIPHKQHPDPEDCTPQVAVQGIVMAQYNNQWKPITTDGWNMHSAHVVCGELGYPLALGIPTLEQLWSNWNGEFCKTETFEPGSGSEDTNLNRLKSCSSEEITKNDKFRETLFSNYLRDLECSGKERRLLDCYFAEFGPYYNPGNVATIRCGFKIHKSCPFQDHKEVYRTKGRSVSWKGRIEVKVNGEWGTVCDRQWGFEEANVVCRAMGYGTAKFIFSRGYLGRGVGPIHYANLKCEGNELTLAECKGDAGESARYCRHLGDAGVECNAPPKQSAETMGRIVRVDDNNYPYPYVEVKGWLGWGQICVESLSLSAANVLCRETQGMFALRITSRDTRPGYDDGVLYQASLYCKGDEARMEDCSYRYFYPVQSCREGFAMLDCSEAAPDLVPHLEVFEESLKYYPYLHRLPMSYLECAYQEGCLSSSAHRRRYDVNHYRVLLRFSSQTMNYGTTNFLPNLRRHQWEWHTCHNHFHSFEAFINYDLLDMETGVRIAEGHKASFCLEDSICESGSTTYRCSSGHQGISINCGDLYARHLDCQWIDVTDVPPGTYILRQHVNPDKLVMESDFTNNIIQCEVTLGGAPYYSLSHNKCQRIESRG